MTLLALRLALIGHPVNHSRSPAMHRAALAASGLRGDYEALDVPPERLPAVLERLSRERYTGFNVTAPHKRAVATFLETLDPLAAEAGAVNTVVREPEGRWRGHNTDAEAVPAWLAEAGRPLHQGVRAVVLGTGGAARAMVAALRRAGAEVLVVGRRLEAARALVRPHHEERAIALSDRAALRAAFARSSFLLQASSATLGTSEQAERFVEALPLEALPAEALVGDLVYAPRRTTLLCAAEARGLPTADGLAFLVLQGARSFQLWTQRPAPLEVMRMAAEGIDVSMPKDQPIARQ